MTSLVNSVVLMCSHWQGWRTDCIYSVWVGM